MDSFAPRKIIEADVRALAFLIRSVHHPRFSPACPNTESSKVSPPPKLVKVGGIVAPEALAMRLKSLFKNSSNCHNASLHKILDTSLIPPVTGIPLVPVARIAWIRNLGLSVSHLVHCFRICNNCLYTKLHFHLLRLKSRQAIFALTVLLGSHLGARHAVEGIAVDEQTLHLTSPMSLQNINGRDWRARLAS